MIERNWLTARPCNHRHSAIPFLKDVHRSIVTERIGRHRCNPPQRVRQSGITGEALFGCRDSWVNILRGVPLDAIGIHTVPSGYLALCGWGRARNKQAFRGD
jgi:hypothetical protein